MRAPLLVLSLVLSFPLAAQEQVPTARDTVRANVAIARSDLRNLVVANERFYANHSRYTSNLDSARYIPSSGSRIVFSVIKKDSWAATLTRERLAGSCVIFVNLPAEERPKTAGAGLTPSEGDPLCDAQPELSDAAPAPSIARPPSR